MKPGRTLKAILVFVLLVALQYTFRPFLGWRVTMDFLVIAVLLMAVRVRPATAALLGFAIGMITDSLTPTTLGAGALAMTTIGFGASWLKAVFFADNVVLHAFYFFAGKWAYDVIYVLASHRTSFGETAMQLLLWSPLAAALTALAGVVIILLFRTTLEPKNA